jgi:membrane protein required for colicin V production
MSGLQLTLFDIIALVVVGLSALAATMRGAVREILGLASWVGAAVVAFLALPFTSPLVRPVVASDGLADGVAAVSVFLVALVAFKMLSRMMVRAVEGSAVGPLDKLLGFAFGAARGVFVVCAAYLAGTYLIRPELQPEWVRNAYLIGPVQNGAHRLEAFLPEAYRPKPASPPAATATNGEGYSDRERRALEKLLAPQP